MEYIESTQEYRGKLNPNALEDMYKALKIGVGLALARVYRQPDDKLAQIQLDEIRQALAKAEGTQFDYDINMAKAKKPY